MNLYCYCSVLSFSIHTNVNFLFDLWYHCKHYTVYYYINKTITIILSNFYFLNEVVSCFILLLLLLLWNSSYDLDILYTPEGDKYLVARKWGHINIVSKKWLDQSVERRGISSFSSTQPSLTNFY